MHIAVDGNEANVENLVGVSVYTLKLLQQFQKKADKNLRFTVFLREKPKPHLPEPTEFFRYKFVWGPFLWSRIFLPFALLKAKLAGGFDVFFAPAHYSPKFIFTKLVVAIHDLSHFHFPKEFLKKDLYKLKNWTKESVEKAEKIIAVSKTTKKDLIKFYNLPDEKIKVIYNGWEKTQVKPKKTKINLKPKKYCLFVSTIQPRKNIARLAQAFDKFKKQTRSDLRLVIAGKKGWLWKDIFRQIEKLENKDQIIFTGYVDDAELAWLYKNALFFIHPSLYEGFGLPVLEAFSWGLPTACSFTGSLPEIAGEASIYFNPLDIDDMADKIRKLWEDGNLRERLSRQGKQRLKDFSWKKCGQETLEVIRSITR